MGIGSTIKNMMRDDSNDQPDDTSGNVGSTDYDRLSVNESQTNPPGRSPTTTTTHKLPPGTGPGTTGKPATGHERNSIQGVGTDAAAAHGGSLAGTHRERYRALDTENAVPTSMAGTGSNIERSSRTTGRGPTVTTSDIGQAAPVTTGRADKSNTRDFDRVVGGTSTSTANVVIEPGHHYGHTKETARDVMPSGAAQEDTNQLSPVTHERVRHLETEEVQRVKERERHIHHIQHHIQPIYASEVLTEQEREMTLPVTNVQEIHANKVEDNTLFEGQVRQHHDTLTHSEKERTVIDKGTTVVEHTHHHVHHVIQPIIEKETVEKQRTKTTVPIHEVTHEAPVVHQSQTHSAVPIEHFLQRGGTLEGAITQDNIGSRVLHGGECTRSVDGLAENITHINLNDKEPTTTTTTTTTSRTHHDHDHDHDRGGHYGGRHHVVTDEGIAPTEIQRGKSGHRPRDNTDNVPVVVPIA